MILNAVVIASIMVVVGILYSEIGGWRSGEKCVTRFQMWLRIASAALMVSVLGMILIGDAWVNAKYGPLGVMAWWLTCFALTTLLIIVALFDLREVGVNYRKQRRQILENAIKRCEEANPQEDDQELTERG